MSFLIEQQRLGPVERAAVIKLLRPHQVWIWRGGRKLQEKVEWNCLAGIGKKGQMRLPLCAAALVTNLLSERPYDAGDRAARLAPFELRPEQQMFVERLLRPPLRPSCQAWDLLPSFGKTRTALYAAAWLGLKTTILCHRVDIRKMWQTEAEQFGVSAEVIMLGELGRSGDLSGELLIVDEAHACCTKIGVRRLALVTPLVLIGLSGTFYRSDLEAPYVGWFFGPRLRLQEDARRVFQESRTGKIYYRQIQTGQRPKTSPHWGTMLESLAVNQERNEMILQHVLREIRSGKKLILFVKSCDHGRVLRDLILAAGHMAYCRFADDELQQNFDCVVTTYS